MIPVFFGRSSPRAARRALPGFARPGQRPARRAFSLVELLVVTSIIGVLIAMSYPVLSALMVNTRLDNAAARLKGAALQAQNVLSDNLNVSNRNDTMPRIVGARYAGVALVVRWDDIRGEYEIFFAQHAQGAKDGAGINLANADPALNKFGYSRVTALEPVTLGTGVRIAGVRRNDVKPGKLEVLPDNFVVTLDAQSSAVPFAQQVYVNLTDLPSSPTAGVWNTAGLYTGGDVNKLTTQDGFLTSLPMMVVYYESDFGGPVPVGTDPNDLLKAARSRVVILPLQGGAPLDF